MEEKLRSLAGQLVLTEPFVTGGGDRGETHEGALRTNTIYDALLKRRESWYQKYRQGKGVPEVTPEIAKRYKRQAVRLVEAAKTPVDFLGSLEEKGYRKSTVKDWGKRVDLATRVLQEKFGGKGVAIAEGKTRKARKLPRPPAEEPLKIAEEPEKVQPAEMVIPPAKEVAPVRTPEEEELPIGVVEEKPIEEKPRIEVIEEERMGVRQRISAAWQGLRRGFRARLSEGRATLEGTAAGLRGRITEHLPEKEEVEDLLAKGKVRILSSPEAVKDWVGDLVDKLGAPFTPLTRGEQGPALEAQKIEIPEFIKQLSPPELVKKLKEMDPATRKKVAITLGVTAGVLAVGGLGYYEIVGRHGAEFQMVAHYLSGIGQAGKELIAKATEAIPTATGTPTQAATAIPPATPIPSAPMPPVSPGISIPPTPGGVEGVVPQAPNIADQVRAALTARYQEMQLAAAQMRHLFQTGVEVVRGGSVWQASGKAAEQILGASGVQSDPERLTIVTDAIKDLAVQEPGLKGVVQPGAVVKINPTAVADRLAATLEHIKQVQAAGGTLEVPVDQADLTALAKLVKFLKGF